MFSSFMGSVLPAEPQQDDDMKKKDSEEYETVEETSSSSSSSASLNSSEDDEDSSLDANAKQVVALQQQANYIFLTPSLTSHRSKECSPLIDFSGEWTLIVSEDFKTHYDEYLTNLGLSWMVRSVASSVISNSTTTEEIIQANKGKMLTIRSNTVRGTWDRTLQTTAKKEEDDDDDDDDDDNKEDEEEDWFQHTISTAESEVVPCESWWENYGSIHRSFMYNTTKYNGGGDFESRRYLVPNSDDNNSLEYVCESIFHPKNESLPKAQVTWRFCKMK